MISYDLTPMCSLLIYKYDIGIYRNYECESHLVSIARLVNPACSWREFR